MFITGAGRATGAFSRGGVARASMFEQRSRRRQPPVPPHQRMSMSPSPSIHYRAIPCIAQTIRCR